MPSYGSHLMGDLDGCRLEVMRDGEFLYKFMKNLVTEIGMEPIGSPHLDLYCGPHKEWDGFSATVHIQSSHITCHVFAFGYVFMDIFSCKPINVAKAQRFIRSAWNPSHEVWQTVHRGRNFPAVYIDALQLEAQDA